MHSLVDDWHPKPCTSRPGKSWRVVILARLSLTGKQTSKYFESKTDAERFISAHIRNLKRFDTVNGKINSMKTYNGAGNTANDQYRSNGTRPRVVRMGNLGVLSKIVQFR